MLTNIGCLIEACEELRVPYTFIDDNKNMVMVGKNGALFLNATTPFNSEAISHVCRDKQFTYLLGHKSIRMPKTKGYLDPTCDIKYSEYMQQTKNEEIVTDILTSFTLPVIVKSNFGSTGKNVFKCINAIQVRQAVDTVFTRSSANYSYVCVPQEYVHPKKEFRVILFDKKIEFAYEKNILHAHFTGNLSPLHWEGAQAILIESHELLEKLQSFISSLFESISLEYGGLDIIEDNVGRMWLIEVNTKPQFNHFVHDNGTSVLRALYIHMLTYLMSHE